MTGREGVRGWREDRWDRRREGIRDEMRHGWKEGGWRESRRIVGREGGRGIKGREGVCYK